MTSGDSRDDGGTAGWQGEVAEGAVLALACAAPWMFGSVEAWAVLVLEVGVGVAAVLVAVMGCGPAVWKNLTGWPSLGLAGLVGLAAIQASPMPARWHAALDPAGASDRAALLPDAPERVQGDTGPPVRRPPATLSLNPGATRDVAVRLAAAWLLYQAVLGLGVGPGALRRFGWAFAANGAALALFSIVQALTWNGKIFWYYPTSATDRWSGGGPFVSHTHLAETLNLGLGLALGLLLGDRDDARRPGRSGRWWAAYLAGVLVIGVVLSHSRSGFLAMLVALAVTLAGFRGRRALRWGVLVAVVGLPALYLLALGDSSTYTKRLGTILDPHESGYWGRIEVWGRALRVWKSRPLFGTGFGTFASAVDSASRVDVNEFFARAENEYVDVLTESGVAGIGLVIVCLAAGVGRARRALAAAESPADRALILGGCAGLGAVLANCVSDFGLHVPGVAVPAVILYAHLCRLGVPGGAVPTASWGRRLAGAFGTAAVAAAVVAHGYREARAEALVTANGLPSPDSLLVVSPATPDLDEKVLRDDRAALTLAVRLRPDWAEGHLRLGLTEVALYRSTVAAWLAGSVPVPSDRLRMADPLWLLTLLSEGKADPAALLAQAPIQLHLVPAARSFLEARRCSPGSPLAHVELGALSWLLEPAGTAGANVQRALRTAGPHAGLLLYTAEVALRSGDTAAAVACWRAALRVHPGRWSEVADAAAGVLAGEELIDRVVPEEAPHVAILLADRLYPKPGDRPVRERFLRAAVGRLAADRSFTELERTHLEAQIWQRLGAREKARARMLTALGREPTRSAWRRELIDWLLAWGDAQEAHNQALTAAHFTPNDPLTRGDLARTAEALARGGNADSVK